MSEQALPSSRSVAPAPRPQSRWFTRHRGLALWGVSLIGLGIVLYVLTPEKQEEIKPYQEPPRSTHVDYVAPTPTTHAAPATQVPTAPTTFAAPATTTQATSAAAAAPEPPKLTSYSYGRSNYVPEYMKAKKDAAVASATVADGSGGIAYKQTSLEGTKSFTVADASRILPPFSTIICVLDTAVVTGVSGITPFRCHLRDPVESPLHVTLLEAGTKVGGYYQSVVNEGQSRVVMVTATAWTTNNVGIELGGPVGDSLGAAGVPGTVDNHWSQRIGGALLLSAADAALSLAQSEIQKNSQNTNISIGNGGGGGSLSGLASQLLAKTINIPPTISLSQGTVVTLWTTKVLNFNNSYRLESR